MPALTKAELAFWERWHALDYLCCRCGAGPRSGAYIQPRFREGARVSALPNPQPDRPRAVCAPCIDALNRESREIRRRELAAMDRCEVDGCRMRGTAKAGRIAVLLCGRHLRRVKAAHHQIMAGGGGLSLFLPPPDYSRANLIAMATGKPLREADVTTEDTGRIAT